MTLDDRRIPVSQLDDEALQQALDEAGVGRAWYDRGRWRRRS